MRFKRRNEDLFTSNVIDMEPYLLAIVSIQGDQEEWERLTAHYYRYGYVQDVPKEQEYDAKKYKKYNRKKSKEQKKKKKNPTKEKEK